MKIMGVFKAKTLWLTTSAIGVGILFLIGIVLFLPAPTKSQQLPGSYPASVQKTNHTPDYAIIPRQMDLDGDAVVCEGTVIDPIVASWCDGAPAGTIILGVDPASSNPADWDGGSATAKIYIGEIVSPTVAVLSVTWPDRDGKGIHSPQQDRLATITWDGTPIWTKRTRDSGTFNNDYYAAEHRQILATAVLTQPVTHTLSFQVSASTAWDISSISIDFHPMWENLRGIAYSPFRDCQNPHWGPFSTETEVREDIARLFHMTNGIRTYSALNITGEIPRIADEYGLPVCAGAWLGREKDAEGDPVENKNREEIDALINIANTVPLDCVIVGNEVLLRGDLTEAELLAYIQEVQAAVDVPVTTAEVSGLLHNYPDLVDELDLIMVHIYPSWDGHSIDGAVNYVIQHYLYWRTNYPDKRIIIGETGWPSDGPPRSQAVPSLDNQRRFFYSFLAAAELLDIEFYYFDAFDELWKREGGVGSHWGYTYSDRTGKHEVQSVLIPGEYLFPYSVYLPMVLKGQQSAAVQTQPILQQPRLEPPTPALEREALEEFVVFSEYASEENHFAPSGWMGDMEDIGFYECARSNPYAGEVSLQVTYNPQGPQGWGGIYWQEPDNNWGMIEGAGYDLDDATFLQFHARGEEGGEQVKFLMGGTWGPYPDSQQPALSTDVITLTQTWTTYTIDLRGRDLSQVIGGFAFVTDQCLNTEPITFYLDDIHYVIGGDPGPPAPTPTPDTPYTFDVYRDKDLAGNHYVPTGQMGDTGDIQLDECWRGDSHSGGTAIRVAYTAQGAGPSHGCDGPSPCGWAGVYWQDPANNWGDRPGGYDLTGARGLIFWAKGEAGGEWISFKAGGIGCGSAAYPDSLCPAQALDPAPIDLTNTWQLYTVPLSSDLDLSDVVGGFMWSALAQDNPSGATFYLDDIQYLFNVDVPLQPHWIYYGPRLADGYDMGVNTSGGLTNWVRDEGGYMCMDYPSGQSWGAVFITVGPPTDPPRPGKDLSAYQTLSLELKGGLGGEYVWIGLKDNTDPDNGQETKLQVSNLTTEWQTETFSLSDFKTADPTRLYVVTLFVFEPGTPAETVCFRRIQYLP